MIQWILVAFLLFFGLPREGGEATLNNYLIQLSPQQFQKLTADLDMEYNWKLEDIQDSALMVQTECGHLGEDCGLSVMSTAYGRFKNERWCWKCKNISDVIFRPGQFAGPEVAVEMYGKDAYDIIRPESYLSVYKFILGFRGSCSNSFSGFEYFNSYEGGPLACQIVSESGSFMDFFSTESYESARNDSNVKDGFNFPVRFDTENGYIWKLCDNDRRCSLRVY